MKLVAVALLVVGMLSNSMLAVAEDPVPFRALMQTASAQPTTTPIAASQDQSTAVPSQPAPRPMTSGGKIMTGTGLGLCVVGVVVLVSAAVLNSLASPSHKAEAYGGGGGAVAGGAILVVLGSHHRRSAK